MGIDIIQDLCVRSFFYLDRLSREPDSLEEEEEEEREDDDELDEELEDYEEDSRRLCFLLLFFSRLCLRYFLEEDFFYSFLGYSSGCYTKPSVSMSMLILGYIYSQRGPCPLSKPVES